MERAKLAVFAPLPPCQNGIADYAFELLPLHAGDFDVTVVLEDGHPAPAVGDSCGAIRIIFLADYQARRAEFGDHIHLYHLGNNPNHAYMLQAAMERPGVIVLHDVSLHYLLDCTTLRWEDFAGYTAFLQREYGHHGELLGDQFEKYRWRDRAMFYELPVTRTLLSRAKGIVVHSAFGYFKVKAQCPEVPVTLIPHHLTPVAETVDQLDRVATRKKLGLDAVKLTLLSLGFITKAKQVDAVFHVLARIRDELPPFRYVLAGSRLPEQFDVDREIARYGLEDVVTVTEYLDETTFFEYVAAADLVINLRYPTGGETSGTLIRALGCGACVVVVDHGPFAELPDDICIKVPWSAEFLDNLETALVQSLSNAAVRREIGDRAKRFLRDRHAIGKSASAYRAILLDAMASPEAPWGVEQPHRFLTLRGREQLFAETGLPTSGALWVREAILPEAHAGRRLVLASDQSALQLEWLARHGYGPDRIDWLPVAPEAPRPPRRGADAALYAATKPDIAAFRDCLARLNEALAFGGILVVDLVQAEDSGSDLLTNPARVEAELSRAGFRLLHRALGGASDVSLAPGFRGDDPVAADVFEACWQAVKITEFTVRGELPLTPVLNRAQIACPA